MVGTMDEIREELNTIARESMEEAIKNIISMKEEILIAFIAKQGLQPDEVVICYQGTRCWVEKRFKEELNGAHDAPANKIYQSLP